jgi:ATP-dependent DNA helicase RecQ
MRDQALSLLQEMTSNPAAEFHQHQYEAISELVENRRKMLVVQKTGWGKSAVYFIATKLLRQQGRGPSIIISPLIALMRNQIDSARRLGLDVVTINSSLSPAERTINENKITNQQVDAIIISPEQLANENLVSSVLSHVLSNTGLFVVDEAHCISDWGHDFRPDYRRIVRIIQHMPDNMPILATTATANDRVVTDIQTQIGSGMITLRGELMRSSLHLQNIPQLPTASRLAWLSETIPKLMHSGIVYAKTMRDCDLAADWLQNNGIDARAYYGGIDSDERIKLEDDLINNRLKVLVSTSALGMGFDKPDIGFVIHFQAPGNVIEYYQQVGRAGRGIDNAHGVLMLGEDDERIQQFFINNAFPSESQVQQVLTVLEESDGLKKSEIEPLTNLSSGKIDKVLKFLSVEDPSPIYKDGATFTRTAIDYELPYERIHRLSTIKVGEWQQLLDYHQSTNCLMHFLADALDDELATNCGKCANCAPQEKLDVTIPHDRVVAASEFMKNRYVKIKPRKLFGTSGALALSAFPVYKFPYKDAKLQAQEGLALSRWRDGIWGDLVADGKRANAFSDELIAPMVRMINTLPAEQRPTWLTYVPSLRHPDLVKNFAHKLAAALNIRCTDAVTMAELRPAQKEMENSFRRSENLDGAFNVDQIQMHSEPVFLLDDAIDSGWTFTVVAALLKRQGAGNVYPIALTSTSVQG